MSELDAGKNPRKRLRTKYVVIALLVLVCVLLVAWALWFFAVRETGPIPRKYRKGLYYTLYYPTRLPDGFSVDKNSFERNGNVLTFKVNTPYDRIVTIAEQPFPTGMPVHDDSNTSSNIPGERAFDTNIGRVHIGLWGANYVADIITDETWVIINVTGLTADQAIPITQSFSRIK